MCFLIGLEAVGLYADQRCSLKFNKVILDWMDGEILCVVSWVYFSKELLCISYKKFGFKISLFHFRCGQLTHLSTSDVCIKAVH